MSFRLLCCLLAANSTVTTGFGGLGTFALVMGNLVMNLVDLLLSNDNLCGPVFHILGALFDQLLGGRYRGGLLLNVLTNCCDQLGLLIDRRLSFCHGLGLLIDRRLSFCHGFNLLGNNLFGGCQRGIDFKNFGVGLLHRIGLLLNRGRRILHLINRLLGNLGTGFGLFNGRQNQRRHLL